MTYKNINVVADIDAERFKTNTSKAIDEMQNDGYIVEVQYTSNIQLDGRLLMTALILGKTENGGK